MKFDYKFCESDRLHVCINGEDYYDVTRLSYEVDAEVFALDPEMAETSCINVKITSANQDHKSHLYGEQQETIIDGEFPPDLIDFS